MLASGTQDRGSMPSFVQYQNNTVHDTNNYKQKFPALPWRYFPDSGGSPWWPLGTVRPIYRTGTPLPTKHPILYIFSTNIRTEFFKHTAHFPLFSHQNAVFIIMLPFLVPVLFTFYIQAPHPPCNTVSQSVQFMFKSPHPPCNTVSQSVQFMFKSPHPPCNTFWQSVATVYV
jgi:hypothetical protein